MSPVDGYRSHLPGQPHSDGDNLGWAVFCPKCLNEVIKVVTSPDLYERHTCGVRLDATEIQRCPTCRLRLVYFSGHSLRDCRNGRHDPTPSQEWPVT
jgi:hypothetical protein